MTPTYTHTFDDVAVNPRGDWSIVVKKASEDFPYCKDYRLKLEGELIFAGDDYDLINGYDCCDQIEHKIYCDGVLYFVCYWGYPLQFEFDEDLCQTKGTPDTLDKYYWFDRKAEEKILWSHNYVDIAWEADPICDDVWGAIRPQCTLLFWIIDWFAGQVHTGMNAVSTFFENDLFPDLTNPYPADNYVTGFPNKLNHVIFAMAKHIYLQTLVPEYPTTSWNELMTLIHEVFNTWWYVDEQGDLRIENKRFWDLYFPASYDLTTIDGGRWIENSSKYSYFVEELPQRELWNWNEHINSVDFLEQIIIYDCSLGGTNFFDEEHLIQDLTTDVEYIAQNWLPKPAAATDIDASVYMFLRCIPVAEAEAAPFNKNPPVGTDYCIWYSQGAITAANHLNAHLSAANLHVNYWIYDRPFWEGTMIGAATVFESTERIKKQTEIFFPVCCDNEAQEKSTGVLTYYEFGIVMNEFITTQYGNGEIYTGTIDFGNFTIELVFENDCKPDPYVPTVWPDKEYY